MTELTGEAVSTTAAIGGVELSFDDGTTGYQAPAPDAGWGSNDELWDCAFTPPEGDVGVISQALDANGDPVPGATGQCLSGLKSGSIKLGKSLTAKGVVTPSSLAGSRVTLTAQLKKGTRWVKAKTFTALITPSGAYGCKY